jgi:hypothetical protein
MSQTKDLTKEPPRSPRKHLGGFAILARSLDKGRAFLAGKNGEYHFDCPLDNMLFGFKGVKGDQIKEQLQRGDSDDQIAAWLNSNGAKKTAEEIAAWDGEVEKASPYGNPEKRAWFSGECAKVGLDPAKASLFDYLEADDKVSFKA